MQSKGQAALHSTEKARGTPTTPRDDDVMANTFTSLHFHLVFSTKNRAPFLSEEQGGRMHEYLGDLLRAHGIDFDERFLL